ncbi:MAG: MG2 domain-containing protein, partial [Longimicrobiales bacterium]
MAPSADTLRVMRVYPTDDADPRAAITITFDRPVALDPDSAVSASSIFRIEPNIAGKVEWRDPVTLRFVPAAPLVADAEYRVRIANGFKALDGSRLEQPYSFTVRVRAPTVLGGFPLGTGSHVQIGERPVFRVLLSDRADPERVASRTWVTMGNECGGARVAMRYVSMRLPVMNDPSYLYYRHVRDYRGVGDSLRDRRRMVELVPESVLPLNCSGQVSLPFRLESAWDTTFWKFRTYGPMHVRIWPCARPNACSEPVHLQFSTPVRGTEVLRHVRILPALSFTVYDTAAELVSWVLQTRVRPRQRYMVVVDSQLTDVFGQRLGKQADTTYITESYAPALLHPTGMLLVERNGLRTLAVRSVNVDTVEVRSMAVPDSAEYAFLNGSSPLDEVFHEREASSVQQQLVFRPSLDRAHVTGVRIPAHDARTGSSGSLRAVQVKRYVRPDARVRERARAPLGYRRGQNTTALIQVTDLAVHARIGEDQGLVWVTGVRDGRPRPSALVTMHDKYGKLRATARTDARGFALLTNFNVPVDTMPCGYYCIGFEGYISARLNDDRALVGINSDYQAPLAPFRFQINTAWNTAQRTPAAVAVFTERNIYRPGERVYAKAIVREGPLGALTVPRGDSVKWEFLDHANAKLRDTITALSGFGTADQAMTLPVSASLGNYQLRVSLRRGGDWQPLGSTIYRVAEYRAPEFLAEMQIDTATRMAGDTLMANISARYLFGAPMADAEVRWTLQQRTARPWELGIPNAGDWHIGEYASADYYNPPRVYPVRQGAARLDAQGTTAVRVVLPAPANGTAARTDLYAVVTDANRQSVTVARRVVVHAAALYVGTRITGTSWLWTAGQPQTLEVIALQPDGDRMAGVSVAAAVIRREWQATRRAGGGDMVSDTVATCSLQTRADPVSCTFTPQRGGSYVVALTARDAQGRTARTSFERWAVGAGWNPRGFQSPFQIEVTPDRPRYSVGDTATLIIASPFKGVEAWLTVERERILESRRIRLDSGTSTVKVPITEAHAPNAFVSVLLVRGRSAAPGPPDDPGRPTLRVGYAELRVASDYKRLDVQVAPLQPEYRPGEEARVRVAVKQPNGRAQRAEVTLWAVDEGVLALTDYRAPDPVELIYQPRGAGMRLASNLVAVAAQVPDGWRGPDT